MKLYDARRQRDTKTELVSSTCDCHSSIRKHMEKIARDDDLESITMATRLISIIKLVKRKEIQLLVHYGVTGWRWILSSLHSLLRIMISLMMRSDH